MKIPFTIVLQVYHSFGYFEVEFDTITDDQSDVAQARFNACGDEKTLRKVAKEVGVEIGSPVKVRRPADRN